MLDDFGLGTIVRLKSGGPSMTVHSSKAHRGDFFTAPWWDVTCVWFDKNGDLQTSKFNSVELVVVGEEQVLMGQKNIHAVP